MRGEEARGTVAHALAAGYRLIDTSEQYANEQAVGSAIRDSGVSRDEIFVTSKFNAQWHSLELVARAYERSLQRLGLDYLDLFLIHWPNPWLDRYVDAWRGLITLRDDGLVRAIGVSNFTAAHLERLMIETGVTPAVNQIELDPTLPRRDIRSYHAKYGIATQSWGALGRDGTLLRHPLVLELAAQRGKSPAQVVLRWHLECRLALIVRSTNPGRIEQNIDVFDFALSDDDHVALRTLDEGRVPGRDADIHGH